MTLRRVAVFGSSVTAAGTPEYGQAQALGRQLAEAGFEVWNGGYLGVMGAVSKGAYDAGGRVVGVTVESWDRFHPGNAWLSEKIVAPDLHTRLRHLTTVDAAVALYGGLGTLTEVALFWSIAQLGRLARLAQRQPVEPPGRAPAEVVMKLLGGPGDAPPSPPLLLVGPAWVSVMDALCTQLAIGPADRELVTMVDDVEACMRVLETRRRDLHD